MMKKKNLSNIAPRKTLSEKNLELCGIPREFWHTDFRDLDITRDNNKAIQICHAYVDEIHKNYFSGLGIFFYGPNGVGKSWLASIILQYAYMARYNIKMITTRQLVDLGIRSQFDSELQIAYEEAIMNRDFLVVDELGKEPQGEKQANIIVLDELMKYRSIKGLPTILITNLDTHDFKERYGASLVSMILGNYIDIRMAGADFRRKKYKEKIKPKKEV